MIIEVTDHEEASLLDREKLEEIAERHLSKEFVSSSPSTSVSKSEIFVEIDNSDSEKSIGTEDTPDSSTYPAYSPTTESLDSLDKQKSRFDCSCVDAIRDKWYSFRNTLSSFSSRQMNTFLALFIGTMTSSLSVCLFPPFFPKLAESKGETATIYGIVIGTNCLTAFIFTPIIARKLECIGVNFAFLMGIFCSGACCALSGCLEYFPCGPKFVSVAIIIRVCHATSNACVITSTIAFIASEFPNSVAFLFSLMRATMNLAQLVGPIVGGALHSIGGFKMPFFVLGLSQMLMTIVCIVTLPTFNGNLQVKRKEEKSLWAVFKVPGIWISFITFIFSTMSNGFLSITLEPLVLRKFMMSPLCVGLLFGLKDGANCVASPVWGWICDKLPKVKILILLGSIMAATSFILLGPFPGLPIPHTMSIVVLSLVLNGFGVGGQQVAGVVSAMRDAVSADFPDEAETHAFIAGLWSSLSGAGRFIARTGSGILVDHIGFQITSGIVTGLHLFVILSTSVYMAFSKNVPTKLHYKNEADGPNQNSPSDPILKSRTNGIAVPSIREDLEDSFMICSSSASRMKYRYSK